jgi:hypothetical protein
MHGSKNDLEGRFICITQLEAFGVLEQNVPSPLAGEGQGEGAPCF